jgi:hypothetical protein
MPDDRNHIPRFLAHELTTPERSLLLRVFQLTDIVDLSTDDGENAEERERIHELRDLLCGDHAGRYLDKG